MDQEDFEAQAETGECPTCKTQRDPKIVQRENDLKLFDEALLARMDRGKTL